MCAYFKIVSKLRLYRELTAPQSCRKPDTALLLITMQLHTRSLDSSDPPNRELYGLAKACCSHVERSNILSVRLLQATLLITLYEIANAIYPAAYLSVGHCARLGHAIGIHDFKRAPQMLHTPSRHLPLHLIFCLISNVKKHQPLSWKKGTEFGGL
jgi:hypothetical protein